MEQKHLKEKLQKCVRDGEKNCAQRVTLAWWDMKEKTDVGSNGGETKKYTTFLCTLLLNE